MKRRDFLKTSAALSAASLCISTRAQAATPDGTLAYAKPLPVDPTLYDLVVAGGGPAGCAAALAAARGGLKVLLVEGQGQLGGTATSGLVSHWLGGRDADCKTWAVGGLFKELATEAAAQGFALLPEPEADGSFSPFGWNAAEGTLTAGVPFDPFRMALFLDAKLAQAGVKVLLATQAVDVRTSGSRITHLIVFNKSGLSAVKAPLFVDATGDADLAARSGCACLKGVGDDHGLSPATLQLQMDSIDQPAFASYINSNKAPRFLKEIEKWQAEGKWKAPYNRLITVQLDQPGTFMVNTSRLVGIDGTDGASVTRGYQEGRADTVRLVDFLRENVPGFKSARIRAVAPMLGIRETRRLDGAFTLKVDDLLEGRRFPDTVGFSAYGWDMPDPKRPSYQPMHQGDQKIRDKRVPIPYRVMLPRPVSNLICPGRAVSAEREVLGPLRVMAPCMAMGQAAGAAAVLLAKQRASDFGAVDTAALRDALAKAAAVV